MARCIFLPFKLAYLDPASLQVLTLSNVRSQGHLIMATKSKMMAILQTHTFCMVAILDTHCMAAARWRASVETVGCGTDHFHLVLVSLKHQQLHKFIYFDDIKTLDQNLYPSKAVSYRVMVLLYFAREWFFSHLIFQVKVFSSLLNVCQGRAWVPIPHANLSKSLLIGCQHLSSLLNLQWKAGKKIPPKKQCTGKDGHQNNP